MIDHSGYGLSQCETMLQYDVSHWRSPEPEWSLLMASSRLKVSSAKQRPFCCGRNVLTSRSKPYLNSVSTCSGNDAVNTINAHVTNISEPGDRLSIDVTVPYTIPIALVRVCLHHCREAKGKAMQIYICFLRTIQRVNGQSHINHYSDVTMSAIASLITSLTIVYSTVCSGADQTKHQSSVSLAFVQGIHRWPVNSPHKWPIARKMFPFDDVIMMTDKVEY